MYGSPFYRPYTNYYMFNSYGYGYPWYRYNSLGQSTRYNAQNIAVFSFDSTGQISWSNVLNKNQYDDETDAYIGYSLINTGDQLHFLFNQQEKRLQLLTDQSISPSGQVTRNPTLKNLDQGFEFHGPLWKTNWKQANNFSMHVQKLSLFCTVRFIEKNLLA